VVESAAGSSNVISAYPGKANWNEAISQKVMWMIGTQDQSASLTLNPPDMGPLQVIVNVNNNMVDATFISDNLEVRQALENGMLALRDNMSQSGIVLDQVNIGASGNQAQSFRQEAQAQQDRANGVSQLDLDQAETAAAAPQPRVRASNGLVDIFA
jgi:flagellar hook-length control protein FliK